MRTVTTHLALATAILSLGFASPSDAYVEIQLKSGRSILASSFTDDGEQLLLYRPSGEMRIDRDSVSFVVEHEGVLNERNQPRRPRVVETRKKTSADAPAPVAARPGEISLDDVEPLEIPESEDLEKAEARLTRDLILENRELLFARNRGDDPESIKGRRVHIKRIEKTRKLVNEKLKR